MALTPVVALVHTEELGLIAVGNDRFQIIPILVDGKEIMGDDCEIASCDWSGLVTLVSALLHSDALQIVRAAALPSFRASKRSEDPANLVDTYLWLPPFGTNPTERHVLEQGRRTILHLGEEPVVEDIGGGEFRHGSLWVKERGAEVLLVSSADPTKPASFSGSELFAFALRVLVDIRTEGVDDGRQWMPWLVPVLRGHFGLTLDAAEQVETAQFDALPASDSVMGEDSGSPASVADEAMAEAVVASNVEAPLRARAWRVFEAAMIAKGLNPGSDPT